jgi:hypothetical protein
MVSNTWKKVKCQGPSKISRSGKEKIFSSGVLLLYFRMNGKGEDSNAVYG